jgi:hypothetical protein
VRVEDDPSMTIQAAKVIVTLVDGQVLAKRVEYARGSEQHPLTDSEIEDKLTDLTAFGGSGIDPQPLIDSVWSLDSNPDAGKAMALAVAR